MTINKPGFFITFSLVLFYGCWSQTTNHDKKNKMKFEKLIFHSSRCNGTCPRIDLEIDSSQAILVNREFFITKSETDLSKSGQFKGLLSTEKFNEFLNELALSNYENLEFPNVACCDGVITTLIVYGNGKKKYLKSMTPPKEGSELISFLFKLGTELPLKKTKEAVKLEE
jgi:hypothetical protein